MKAAATLDLRGEACPTNYVRTVLALEEVEVGQLLVVVLQGQEAISNVARSLKQAGHRIVQVENLPDASYRLLIRKETE